MKTNYNSVQQSILSSVCKSINSFNKYGYVLFFDSNNKICRYAIFKHDNRFFVFNLYNELFEVNEQITPGEYKQVYNISYINNFKYID